MTMLDQRRQREEFSIAAKIIPLRTEEWLRREGFPPILAPAEQGRHFLKITLPAIPIAVFTLTFLLAYFIEANDAIGHGGSTIDPLPALLGSLALTAVVAALCASIYSAYCHVTGIRNLQ